MNLGLMNHPIDITNIVNPGSEFQKKSYNSSGFKKNSQEKLQDLTT